MHPTYEPPSTLSKQRTRQASLVHNLAGTRTRKLPSYIVEPTSSNGDSKGGLPLPASASGSMSNGHSRSYSSSDAVDDKLLKYSRFRAGGLRARLLHIANDPNKGWLGSTLRTAVRAGILEGTFWRRTLAAVALLLLASLLLFWRSYETHIELAFHPRNWIKRSIETVPPLSGTCFSPDHLLAAGYNASLASAPKKLTLNPGISMRFGLDCYSFAGTLPSKELEGQTLPERNIYHLYWRADLAPLGDRQILLLKSILVHTEDEPGTSVILWTNDLTDLAHHPSLLALQDAVGSARFSIQLADITSLASFTYMASSPLIYSKASSSDKLAWIDGDLVRVLVLYKHGGIWVDMDTILLRSFRALTEQEWVTQWDCYDKPYAPLNGAVMHFHKGSPYLCEMLYMMSTNPAPRPSTTDWGSLLYHQLHRRLLKEGRTPFAVLPYCLTDGRSCRIDNRLPDPFEKDNRYIDEKAAKAAGLEGTAARELQMKVDSVFSVHLHNQWSKTFPKNGWVDRLIVSKIEDRWRGIGNTKTDEQ